MQPNKLVSLLAAPVLALGIVACGSGGIGDILGGDDPSDRRADLRGEVVEVDESARRIVVDSEDDSRSDLQPQRQERTVYYDDRTVVEYQGDSYRPENLERGDEVDIRLERSGDRDVAEHITVLSDVRAGVPDDDDFDTVVRGTVGDIESGSSRFEVEPEYGARDSELVYYDERTVVLFEGREYQTSSLERGDEVSVTGERRNGRFLADRITVERDATPSSGSTDEDLDDVRGTVRSVDSRDRRIELDLAQGERGDERVFYDSRTVVDLRGRQVSPESLRDGDQVAVSGSRRNGQFVADTIRIVREAAE